LQYDRHRRIDERVARRPRMREVTPIRIKTGGLRHPSKLFASPFILLYSFITLILVGGILLSLPFANTAEGFTPTVVAFFTATSAVTVTGLTLVDTNTYWSGFGQAVILFLIFIGGLGFMTLATFLLIIIGQRITLPERMIMRDTMSMNRLGGLVKLTRNVVLLCIIIYIIGIIFLYWRFIAYFPAPTALWQATFHTISGFNNAGFTILPNSDNLSFISNDLPSLGFLLVLIVLGSIGWSVLVDIYHRRSFSRLTLDTKLVLTTTIVLSVLGSIVMFATEFDNPSAFEGSNVGHKVFQSIFHSISGRTAGFSTMDFGQVSDLTTLLFSGLMFIGGTVSSTAGGIKVTTFAIIIAVVLSSVRGRSRTEAFGREIPSVQVGRAITIAVLGVAVVFFMSLILTLTEPDLSFLKILFETVSAFATNGLSVGVSEKLSSTGATLFIFAMFIGRLGPLALVLALTPSEERGELYHFAKERVKIG